MLIPWRLKNDIFIWLSNQIVDLLKNLKEEDRFEKVLSRAEFRILENKRHKLKFDIALHNAPIKKGYKIKCTLIRS